MNAIARPPDVELAPVPIPVEAFLALARTGVFDGIEGKIELIDGVILMAPVPGNEHGFANQSINMALARALVLQGLDSVWGVRPECGLILDPMSAVSADLAVVPRLSPDGVAPAEALMVVEVVWSSYAHDTGLKARKYAAAGVREYWVVDVAAKAVIVHTGTGSGPDADGWAQVRTVEAGEVLSPMGEPRLRIAVADLF
jgi:Uma2 family endonuclease